MATLPAEAVFSLATSALLAGPAIVLWVAFARTRGLRPLLAALAFTVFLASDLGVFVANLVPGWGDASEPVELASDVVTAALFACAFLLPLRRGGPTGL